MFECGKLLVSRYHNKPCYLELFGVRKQLSIQGLLLCPDELPTALEAGYFCGNIVKLVRLKLVNQLLLQSVPLSSQSPC